jgi:hypothetical protein
LWQTVVRYVAPRVGTSLPYSAASFSDFGKSMRRSRPTEAEIQQLARYWWRAQVMHGHVWEMRERFPNLEMKEMDDRWTFETYLLHWLAALFVLVEGFNKLGLRDREVQRLFNEHLGLLKQLRHQIYHFVPERGDVPEMLRHDRLNWAEELHDAIGVHVGELLNRKANIERFMEKRAKLKPVG